MESASREVGEQEEVRLLQMIGKWIELISLFPAHDPSSESDRLESWRGLEQVLSTLEAPLVHMVVVKQIHFVDIIVQHTSGSTFDANVNIWCLATSSLRHCYKAIGSPIWNSSDFSSADAFTYLLDASERALDQPVTYSSHFKHTFLSLGFLSELLMVEDFADDIFSAFLSCISKLLDKLDGDHFRRRFLQLIRAYVYPLTSRSRLQIAAARENPSSLEEGQADCLMSSHTSMPVCALKTVLATLCRHKNIQTHSSLLLSIIRVHAAVCTIPLQQKGLKIRYPKFELVRNAVLDQNKVVSDFMEDLYGNNKSFERLKAMNQNESFRSELASILVPLICSYDFFLGNAARRLLCAVISGAYNAVRSSALLSIRNVFPDAKSIQQLGMSFLEGFIMTFKDLDGGDSLGHSEEGAIMCNAIDEIIEVFLDFVITRMAIGEQVSDLAKKLSDSLISCSSLCRTKLNPSVALLLQRGSNIKLRGCGQLLEANLTFPKAHYNPPYVAEDTLPSMPCQNSDNAIALSGFPPKKQVIDLTSSSSNATQLPTDSWSFLKPKPISSTAGPFSMSDAEINQRGSGISSKQNGANQFRNNSHNTVPLGPFSRLDNSITRAENEARRNKESVLDRLDREEKLQQAQERRNLVNKRIFGDIDRNPPPNSEDLVGKVMKYSKLNSEFDVNPNWLDSLKPLKEETSWEQQIRELKEAKERARQQAGLKRAREVSAKGPVFGVTSSSTDHSVKVSAAGAVNRSQNSALLGQGNVAEENFGDEVAMKNKSITWRDLLHISSTSDTLATEKSDRKASTDVSHLMKMYLNGEFTNSSSSKDQVVSISDAMAAISIDAPVRKLLRFDLSSLCRPSHSRGGDGGGGMLNERSSENNTLEAVPVRFLEEDHYVRSFTPLLLEEAKAALIAHINGENLSEESRYSSYHFSDAIGRNKPGGGSLVRMRCVLKNARAGQPKLVEVHVIAEQDGPQHQRCRLVKDDLVMVFSTGKHIDAPSILDLVSRPHSLALVLTSQQQSGSGGAGSNNQEKGKVKKGQQQTLLMLTGSDFPQDTVRMCASITSLTSHLREWSALMSIRNHRLMPLTPYLLKGSPVVSSQHLGTLNEAITRKLQSLHPGGNQYMDLERRAKLNAALMEDLISVGALYVDGSVLKNTGIAKTIKSITCTSYPLVAGECETLAGEIITKWKVQVKNDNRASTITNMKGGKLIEMPETDLKRPRCVSPQLWDTFLKTYNKSQLFAIKYVSDQFEGGQDTRVALIQGPPGTGKTFTVLGMVAALLHHYVEGTMSTQLRKRLLICAPSNTAVDELLSRLASGVPDGSGYARVLRIVRLGEPLEGASRAILDITLDTQIEVRLKKEDAWIKLECAKEQINKLEQELSDIPVTKVDLAAITDSAVPTLSKEQQRVRTLRSELANQRQVKVWAEMAVERARLSIRQQILLEADIVGATLSGAGRKQFLDLALQNNVTFDTTIIDEAAQATEPSCLIPLRLGCRRLVLVGDPRQLPATVLSRPAGRAGLGRSLFERLERADHEVVMLTIQYRMHPSIRRFPSQFFYQNLLTDAPAALSIHPISVKLCDHAGQHLEKSEIVLSPLRFLDLRLINDMSMGKSFINEVEVIAITRVLCAILPHIREYTVAVIAPYKAQVNRIKRSFREDNELLPLLLAEHQRNGTDIEVNSVDGFQGREKDIVIFSAVRSDMRDFNVEMSNNGRGGSSIGFVADERRLNVAITRAKRLLIVVGNAGTLSSDSTWQSMLQYMSKNSQIKRVRDLRDLRYDRDVLRILAES